MALGQIPPWLNVSPADFVGAASTGARIGLERSRIDTQSQEAAASRQLEAQRMQQQAMMEQAQLQMQSQKLDEAQNQAQVENQTAKEQLQQNFLLKQQQTDVLGAYHQAQISLGKQKLEEASKASAMTMAQKQGYAQSIASGMSPAEAAGKFPMAATTGVISEISKPSSQKPTEKIGAQLAGLDQAIKRFETQDGFDPADQTTDNGKQYQHLLTRRAELQGQQGAMTAPQTTAAAKTNSKGVSYMGPKLSAADEFSMIQQGKGSKTGKSKPTPQQLGQWVAEALKHPNSAKPQSGSSGDRVTVQKGGKKFTVPASQLDEAVSQGYSEVQ